MLKKFGLEDSKPMKTPMSSDTKLTKDEECESVDSTKYRGMIGTTHLGLWYPKGTGIETVVYADSDHAGDLCRSLFHFVEFECLLEINEQVCPRFILEFYSQYRLSYSDKGQIIPCEGASVFSDRWSLDELVYGAPSEGPYQTNLPSPDDIISYVREDREGQVTRIRHQEEIEVQDYQILTRKILLTLKL
ncbi:hypothetical protein Tco_0728300 [Tanacetum coccineum]|uniref:Uncharacterized protein n=1 Tax=Tanacetum coccineum TaxID=301880 RepID=A0ABQ4YKR8_9ASTR